MMRVGEEKVHRWGVRWERARLHAYQHLVSRLISTVFHVSYKMPDADYSSDYRY